MVQFYAAFWTNFAPPLTHNKVEFDSADYLPRKGPWESLHINADGKVFPCFATSFGDIRDFDTIDGVYQSLAAMEFRALIRNKGTVPACHRCGYLKLNKCENAAI